MANDTTQTTTPWGPVGTGLDYGFGKGKAILDTKWGQPFPGYSPETQAGLASMRAVASGPNPFLGPSTDAVTGVTSGENSIGTGGQFESIFGTAMSPEAFRDQIQTNPYTDSVLAGQQDDIANRVKSSYSTAGRYGSGDFTEALADSLGANANQFNLGRYDIDTRNAMERMGVGLSAASGATGVQGQNIANQMQAASMAPAMSEFRYADPMRMSQVGAARDLQREAEADYPQKVLGDYMSMFGYAPGGVGVSTQSGPEQSSWLSALGGAGVGAGIGSAFGGIGAAAGAGLGALGSWLFG